jgi:hypothetical protein
MMIIFKLPKDFFRIKMIRKVKWKKGFLKMRMMEKKIINFLHKEIRLEKMEDGEKKVFFKKMNLLINKINKISLVNLVLRKVIF